MNVQTAGLEAGLAATLSARREVLPRRLAVAAACALGLAPLIGWAAPAAWVVVYAAMQGAEHRWLPVPDRRVALAFLSLESLLLASLALVAAWRGGGWGAAPGAILLAAALFEAASTRQRSWPAFLATAAPVCVGLAGLAVLAWRDIEDVAAPVAILVAGGVAGLAALRAWKGAAEALVRQRRVRAEADRRRLEADSAAGAAAQFAAAAGRELRAPLNAVLAAAEAIERGAQTMPGLRDQAALIGESGRTMRGLLDDLLDLACLDAGRLRVERAAFDPRELVGDTLALWSAQAERRGLYLRLEGVEMLPAAACGDPMRLRQVLNSLIGHALKATETGGVTLSAAAARLAPEEQRGDTPADWLVRLSVADTAPRTAAQIDRLFAPFDQADAGGLGLSISRELARLMGGDLSAVGGPGGTTFVLEVGLAASPALAAPQALRVLVADDKDAGRRALALMLEPYGAQLAAAASVEQALALLATQSFDVVLMDIDLPQAGGREACRRLRDQPGPNKATPVIACADAGGDQGWEDCRRAGMSGLVVRPIEPAALHAAIAAALRRTTARTAAA